MSRRKKILCSVAVLVTLGSIGGTAGYSLYRRSDSYRHAVESVISNFLGMHITLGKLQPAGWRVESADDLQVFLAEGASQIFSSQHATWRSESLGGGRKHRLELSDGWLLVGTAGWTKEEYRQMLAGGLGHDFAAVGIAEVRLSDIDLIFRHPLAEFTAGGTTGVIRFGDDGDGEGSLECRRLNDVNVDEPVRITVRFTPGEQLVFHEVRISVPSLSLETLGLSRLLGQSVTRGLFDGTITYSQREEGETVELSGSLREADLTEFTVGVSGGPFHGLIDLELEGVTIRDRKLETFSGHGQLRDLRIGEILPVLSSDRAGGRLDVQIESVRWESDKLASLKATGACNDVSLAAISSLIGRGSITGAASVQILSIVVEDDKLIHAEVELRAVPPIGAAGLISGELLATIGRRWLGVNLSAALPENLEYTHLGARLVLDDGKLRVFGTHGPDGRTLLTIKLFGSELGVLRQATNAIDVPDIVSLLRERADDVDVGKIKGLLQRLREGELDHDEADGTEMREPEEGNDDQ